MGLEVGLGRCEQGFLPAAWATRPCARLGFASPGWAEGQPQNRTPRGVSCAGVTEGALGLLQGQAALCEPQAQTRLARLEDATVRMEDHVVIRLRHAPGLRGPPGAGLVHAMPGSPGQHGGKRPPWGRPGGDRRAMAMRQEPCLQPGFAVPAEGG